MKLLEVNPELSDLKDEVQGLLLAAKAAGMSEIKSSQLLFDLRRSGHDMDINELVMVLKGIPGIDSADPRVIKLSGTETPEDKLKAKDDAIISKMASKTLDRKIG